MQLYTFLRCFDDDNITHVDGKINPLSDKETIDIELQLKDLETIEGRLSKTEKMAKANDPEAKRLIKILTKYHETLKQGKSARSVELDESDALLAKDLQLLTNKPILYVCNVDEASAVNGNKYVDTIRKVVEEENAQMLIIAAATEADIAELDDFEERQMFLADIGLDESGVSKLIKAAYKLLELETYFTAGVKEVRAWTYPKGSKAPQCAWSYPYRFRKRIYSCRGNKICRLCCSWL